MKRFIFAFLAITVVMFCVGQGELWAADMEAERNFVRTYLLINDFYTQDMLYELSFDDVFDEVYRSRQDISVNGMIQYSQLRGNNYRHAYLMFEILLVLDYYERYYPEELDDPTKRPVRVSPKLRPCGCPR